MSASVDCTVLVDSDEASSATVRLSLRLLLSAQSLVTTVLFVALQCYKHYINVVLTIVTSDCEWAERLGCQKISIN